MNEAIMNDQRAFNPLILYDGSSKPLVMDKGEDSGYDQEVIVIDTTGSAVSQLDYTGISQAIGIVPPMLPFPDHVNPILHRRMFGDRTDVLGFADNYLGTRYVGKPTATRIEIQMTINIEKVTGEAISRIAEHSTGQAVIFPNTGLYGDHANIGLSHILYGIDYQYVQGKAQPMEPKKIINQEFTWFQRNYKNLKNKYLNEWIVISNNNVISHDVTFIVAIKSARDKGIKRPFIIHVSPEGWEK